ncbi:MAG: hypothetical protein HQ478_12270 [Chloroflexi bacterium]|nr:hypothetical protein [Chloroflexota bacterium]
MPDKQIITEIRVAPVETAFGRQVGRNSKGDPYGYNQREWLTQVKTASGLIGITNARPFMNRSSILALTETLKPLIGRDIFEIHTMNGERVTGVAPRWQQYLLDNGFVSYALFDLMGQALGIPAYKLLGDKVRDDVEPYDSSLYFQDLVHPADGAGTVATEAKQAVEKGWTALKLKLGRPGRWFEPTAGLRRDIDVVIATRDAIGPDIKILVDANNGYDGRLDLLETFIREVGPAKTYWMEEMITEELPGYRKMKEWRDRYSPGTMIVDGESHQGRQPIYWRLMEEGLLDGIQPDMLHMGFWPYQKLVMDISDAGYATKICPHNYNAARIGLCGLVHFAAVTESFTVAEDSTLDFDVYDYSAYEFSGGRMRVPETPGLSITVDQDKYARRHSTLETVIS